MDVTMGYMGVTMGCMGYMDATMGCAYVECLARLALGAPLLHVPASIVPPPEPQPGQHKLLATDTTN